jgi:hypothetical protein
MYENGHSRNALIEELIQAEIAAVRLADKIAALRSQVFVEDAGERGRTPGIAIPEDDVAPPAPRVMHHEPPVGGSMEIATRIVRDHMGPITIAALAELGSLSERQARGCISAMLRSGLVRRVEDGYELNSAAA